MVNLIKLHEALADSHIVKKIKQSKFPAGITFDLTARCNNNCRHCYINLPQNDTEAKSVELDIDEIERIADRAVSNGVLWCLLSGGEPLLRPDFSDIYVMLKKKGLLVSVFTNACLIDETHVKLFKKYKPRELEVTVYGVTEKTYERVTGVKGSFWQFKKGLNLLLENDVPVSLKAMAIRSNVHEIEDIAAFCSRYSKRKFRFDPFLHKRYDFDETRNRMIESERLTKDEIVRVEHNNLERKQALVDNCETLVFDEKVEGGGRVFTCGILKNGYEVSYDGKLRLCASLFHPDFVRDLRKMPLMDAYHEIAENIVNARSDRPEFLHKCNQCRLINLCYFCPANSYLETGRLDTPVDNFCENAHARKEAIFKWKDQAEDNVN